MRFTKGPYGEILPPPLLEGVDPAQVIKRFKAANLASGSPLDDPKTDEGKHALLNLAMTYHHQMRLRQVVAGQTATDTEKALFAAVMAGERLSLRPIGHESRPNSTFAPVLTRLGSNEWQIGIAGQGQAKTFDAPQEKAIEQAQAIYVEWSNAELKS
jgi:hypothetical protein